MISGVGIVNVTVLLVALYLTVYNLHKNNKLIMVVSQRKCRLQHQEFNMT